MNDKKKIHSELSQAELQIQMGHKTVATKILNQIIKNKKFNQYRLVIANLFRRSGLPYKSLMILRPLILKDHARPKVAEIISYSAGLYQIGRSKEARNRLKKLIFTDKDNKSEITLQEQSDIYFHLGLLEMSEWNYYQAGKYFQKVSKIETFKTYRYYLSKLNLSSCLIFYGQLNKSDVILQEIIKWDQINNYKLLLISTLENLIQINIYQKNFAKTEHYLKCVESEIQNKPEISYEKLSLNKWKCVNFLYQNLNPKLYLNELKQVSLQAKKYNFFELNRDSDFYVSFFSNDLNLLNQIYYGTKFIGFKKKIYHHIPDFLPNKNWNLELMNETNLLIEKTANINDSNGQLTTEDIKPIFINTDFIRQWTPMHLKTFLLFLSDSYRPFSIGEIFSAVCTDQIFDPLSSATRIRKLISNLNIELNNKNLPFKISPNYNSFKLVSLKKVQIHSKIEFIKELKKGNFQSPNFFNVKSNTWYTGKELRLITGWSASKVHTWLKQFQIAKKVKTRGSFKDKKYFFVSK